MKKNLLLVTWGFPYGESERSFLTDEFAILEREFKMSILAFDNQEPLIYPLGAVNRVERFTFAPLHKERNPRAFLWLLQPKVIREAWYTAKNSDFRQMAACFTEILSYTHCIWQLIPIIRRIVQEDKISLIYTYWCTQYTLAALYLKKEFPNLTVITRFHGADLYKERAKLFWQPYRDTVSKKTDLLVFACEAAREYFLTHWGQQWIHKSCVAYLGSRSFATVSMNRTDVLRLISCSNVIPLKRIHLILEALALLPEFVQVQWNHIGDGNERESLQRRAAELCADHPNICCKFWGSVANYQIEQLYQEIQPHLFISTTSTEGGVPVSIQEAFAMGLPAIATAVGGIPEIVKDGKTGFLLPPNPTVVEIAEALLLFHACPLAQREALCSAAYTLWQEKFDAAQNAERFISILKQIAAH